MNKLRPNRNSGFSFDRGFTAVRLRQGCLSGVDAFGRIRHQVIDKLGKADMLGCWKVRLRRLLGELLTARLDSRKNRRELVAAGFDSRRNFVGRVYEALTDFADFVIV